MNFDVFPLQRRHLAALTDDLADWVPLIPSGFSTTYPSRDEHRTHNEVHQWGIGRVGEPVIFGLVVAGSQIDSGATSAPVNMCGRSLVGSMAARR
jgi:hypothetical protein